MKIQKELDELKDRIAKIEARNKKVESDKAWETSLARKLVIVVLTYLVIVIFLIANHFPNPLINGIIPTIGFILSTLTLPFFKNWWIEYHKDDHPRASERT